MTAEAEAPEVSARRHWMKFYTADWQADAALRTCSLAARGAWIEMLAVMHKADRVGHLLVNGRTPTDKQLAILCGCTERELKRAVVELEEAGVFSRADDGAIFSRRMVRDAQREATDKANGRKGGNPAVKRGVNPPLDGGDKAQRLEARGQSSSEPEGSAAVIPIDPDRRAWTDAEAILTAGGRSTPPAAKKFFGKLLSDHKLGARELLPALGSALANGTEDPKSYLAAAARGVADRRSSGRRAPADPVYL